MVQAPTPEGLPPSLKILKGLVIGLTLTMIIAVITVVWLLVTRMPSALAQRSLILPQNIALPLGEKAQSFTLGPNYLTVITQSGALLVFSLDGTKLLKTIPNALP
ncbi:MAG: DUF6476 family protein [Paracoccaceae bacterium]|jgi:hypothetical protein|nr:DUF6476 family protein [Paracoccaceae bacterium]